MGDQVEFGLLLHTTEQPSGNIHKAERIILVQMDELWNSTRPIRLRMTELDNQDTMLVPHLIPHLPDISTPIAGCKLKMPQSSFRQCLFLCFRRQLHIHELQQVLSVGFAQLRQPVCWMILISIEIEDLINLNGLKHVVSPKSSGLPAQAGSALIPAKA